MLQNYKQLVNFYENTDEFIAAIEYTSGRFGFKDTLIEKDFLCSMVLMYLFQEYDLPLCFKGGTLLAKGYTDFYRLSEDLDFSISTSIEAKRKNRSALIQSSKLAINTISRYLPFRLSKPLAGTNESRQYNAELVYQSKLWSGTERILIEIGLREPHLIEPILHKTKTLLTDPFSGNPIISKVEVNCLTQQEAYAEKVRAALTRQKLAIRDFYDIDHAIIHELIDLNNKEFVHLVEKKLSIPDTKLIEFGDDKVQYLLSKVGSELHPTLSQRNDLHFDLENLLKKLKSFIQKLKI